ncbi:MAG: nucleotide sugar dehydrogenase [Chloroflexi bacterium]|nr:nucleotide sugar dehydrogenase [Chloroflexota bacterium]
MKYQKICVLGLGYIGLPTACTFATHGIKVIGVDINTEIVRGLQNGHIHIFEPGLRSLVQDAIQSGNLTFQPSPEKVDAFIIAVPTPITPEKKADLKAVKAAAESIVPHLQSGNLVILESTSPPRTTCDIVTPILEKSGLKAGDDFLLAYSPERVLPGKILEEIIQNTRVIGGIDESSALAGKELYSTFVKGDILLTNATTAEMVKLMENTYRDINIATANEFTRLADRFGVNVWEAIDIANRHPRVNILSPGPGVGGHCISVDPWFLVEAAPDVSPLVHTAREVNDGQPSYVVNLMRRKLGTLSGKKISILGLAYKANIDDLRESPAIEIVKLLLDEKSDLTIFEPFKPDGLHGKARAVNSLEDALQDCEIILLLVAHHQFTELVPQNVRRMTTATIAVDMCGGWQRQAWEAAGFQFFKLGQP